MTQNNQLFRLGKNSTAESFEIRKYWKGFYNIFFLLPECRRVKYTDIRNKLGVN